LARAVGSYPACPRFKSVRRYHYQHSPGYGAILKSKEI
jgi:hypothetical protein